MKKSILKDLMLILFGGLLAGVPPLVTTKMHVDSQSNNIMVERKISLLIDFSKTYTRIVTTILPQLEKLEDDIIEEVDKYFENGKRDVENFKIISTKFHNIVNDYQVWNVDFNSKTIIINTLFKTDLPIYDVVYFNPNSKKNEVPLDSTYIDLKRGVINLKKNVVQMVNNYQFVLVELSKNID